MLVVFVREWPAGAPSKAGIRTPECYDPQALRAM